LTILRWAGGMCGDTVLNLMLLSNPHLRCQNRYLDSVDASHCVPDMLYVDKFEHGEIGKMSTKNYSQVDLELLDDQLDLLELSSSINGEHWILKSHVYHEFRYRTIDIIANTTMMPFVINANLVKNSIEYDCIFDYHPMISKIKDPHTLKKFHMFNMAKESLACKNVSNEQIDLEDILGGWSRLTDSLRRLGFEIDQKYKPMYQSWLDANQTFIPGQQYKQLVIDQNFDHSCPGLSIYEQYCLLALSGNKFKIL
jgi:hypothetical protein